MESKKVIYTITSLFIKKVKHDDNEYEVLERNRCRLIGYYYDLETAKKCVENDWGSFDEAGYYNYIVIEKVHEGLYNVGSIVENYALIQSEWWYKHLQDPHSTWIVCMKPEKIFCCNFGIG